MRVVGFVEILRELHFRPVILRNEGPPKVTDSPVYWEGDQSGTPSRLSILYIVGSLIWVVNIITGAVYVYHRHESFGEL